jgi:hypothetical protein
VFANLNFTMQLQKCFILRAFLILSLFMLVPCRGDGTSQIAEFPDQAQVLPATITILNWNAQKGKNPKFASNLKLLLAQEKPDIVFLQEAQADLFEPQQMGGAILPKGGATPGPVSAGPCSTNADQVPGIWCHRPQGVAGHGVPPAG